jgi:hypothetical protein
MADKRVDIILQEVDEEYTIPCHVQKHIRLGIERALKKIDQDQELLHDLTMEQRETA